jgi:hypothetical protein
MRDRREPPVRLEAASPRPGEDGGEPGHQQAAGAVALASEQVPPPVGWRLSSWTTSSRAVSPSCPTLVHRHSMGAPTPAAPHSHSGLRFRNRLLAGVSEPRSRRSLRTRFERDLELRPDSCFARERESLAPQPRRTSCIGTTSYLQVPLWTAGSAWPIACAACSSSRSSRPRPHVPRDGEPGRRPAPRPDSRGQSIRPRGAPSPRPPPRSCPARSSAVAE